MRPAAKNPLYNPWFANIIATFRSPSKCFGNPKARQLVKDIFKDDFKTYEYSLNLI